MCRDLGITVRNDLDFSDHISDIVVRAHRRANLIHRCFVSGNVTLLTRAFLTYVRPLVEYNSVMHWRESRGGLLAGSQASTIGVRELHGDGDDGITAVTAVIPR